MKVTTIGGGSTYTPELVQGFIERHERLGLRELWLMDVDGARLEVVGGFARRMVSAAGGPIRMAPHRGTGLSLKPGVDGF